MLSTSKLFYTLDENKNVIPTDDILKWGEFRENYDNMIIKQDTIKEFFVSTVFLGIDHGFGNSRKPVVFETMIFPPESKSMEVFCRRYTNYRRAVLGHKIACRLVERGNFDDIKID